MQAQCTPARARAAALGVKGLVFRVDGSDDNGQEGDDPSEVDTPNTAPVAVNGTKSSPGAPTRRINLAGKKSPF